MTKQHQWLAGLLAILLFSCGAAVGALAHRYYSTAVVNASGADDWRKHYISEMQTRLSLSAEQVNKLETILDQTKAKYKAVRDEYRPAMLAVKEEQIRQVKALLSSKQVPVYEQILAEREQKAREQEERDREKEQKEAAARAARASGH